MGSTRATLQVGILVFLAAVLFLCGYFFFNSAIVSQKYYTMRATFKDALGVQADSEVDLSGVAVGNVAVVSLAPETNRAVVLMRIKRGVQIPIGTEVTISASVFGGTATVAMFPPSLAPGAHCQYYQPGATIVGTEAFNFTALATQTGGLVQQLNNTAVHADKLLSEATATAGTMNRLLNDPRLERGIDQSIENVQLASHNGVLLTDQLRQVVAADNAKALDSLGNVDNTTAQIKDLADSNKEKLDAIVQNLDATSANIKHITASTNQGLIEGNTVKNLSDTVANLKQATSELITIEDDVHGITGDKGVNADLKSTIHNVAQASGKANDLVTRLSALTGGPHQRYGSGTMQFGSELDFTQNLRTSNFRTDFNVTAPLSSTDFGRLGVYDITGTDRLNLQYGQIFPINKRIDYLAGIYAGKVGVGADYDLFGDNTLSFELYNPNRLRVDAKGRIKLNKQAGIWLGIDDIPRTNGVIVGLDLRR
jgi:phospholipid/cholesterol/gamma-HCH transport system substrate-binding protein